MKIICVCMNYDAIDAKTPHPTLFLKPDTALSKEGWPFFLPEFSDQVEYETELVVKISRLGRCIPTRFAHRYYNEVTLGIDFTARDLLTQLQAKGLPWEISKGFDGSAVCGEWIKLSDLGKDIQDLRFEMKLNGETRQTGHTSDMLHTVDEIVSYASQFFMLKMGDLIFTGTPKGVGTVKEGDIIQASLEDRMLLTCKVK